MASAPTSPPERLDSLLFGQRLKHRRKAAGMTLAELGALVGKPAPVLSQLENGRSEPRLSLIGELASALGCEPSDLLSGGAPSRRAELEIALRRAQHDPRYAVLGLPELKASARLDDDVLEQLVGLFGAYCIATETANDRATTAERSGDRARDANARQHA
jgi:XRE family transcriptional regulator, fatty acid utilization regulator